MIKNLAIAAALTVATVGFTTAASAGYGHHHHHHKFHYGYNYYKPVYVYRHYQPVYHYYKPACTYGWVYKHGYKVWGCVW
jgi:hypothetical protein